MNITELPRPVTIGCIPVDHWGIKGLTCWCKTDLCNGELIPDQVFEGTQSNDDWTVKKLADSRMQEPEF